ncbi:hypothetical protein JTB14_036171 [Gonioctena quinquepunctata]|nr:hypothetical protein JTB14_036171 [Gonioctena quinquepunctata]
MILGFCDSPEPVYGACIHIRKLNCGEKATVNLACAKFRLAPMKSVELPRLELCGALLLGQLLQKVKSALCSNVEKIHLWSDSLIVLAWLNSQPDRLSNRVAEIRELTENCEWRHIESCENPADIISVGSYPAELIDNKRWWHGPSWLSQNIEM